jgi:CheY-like chemotaxis protein
LVVDDDYDIRGMLTQVLELEGYHVVAASNGREALTKLRAGPRPFLILLDLMMPIMNGWEFRAEQDRDAALRGIPVVVLTGRGGTENVEAARAAGHLMKPVELKVLLATVAGYR